MKIRTCENERFRIVAADPVALEHSMARARAILASACDVSIENPESVKARADVGRALKSLSSLLEHSDADLQEALDVTLQARDIWRSLNRPKASFLASMQHARILDRLGEDAQTLELYQELLNCVVEDTSLSVYLDFLYEEQARFYAARGVYEQALALVKQAYALRMARGNARQISETRGLFERISKAL